MGLVAAAGAILFVALLHQSAAARWWRIASFPLWWAAAIGFLQARGRTCVVLAARGLCETADGGTRDAELPHAELNRIRARRIVRQSATLAALVTVATLLF